MRTHTLKITSNKIFLGNDGEENDDEYYGDYLDLCVLKYGANGVLEVSPDFTNNRKPYTIELEHKKETFEYWIEHVSPMMDYDEQLRESVMQNEVFARHVQVLRQEVGDDFEKPPGNLMSEQKKLDTFKSWPLSKNQQFLSNPHETW